MKKEVNFASMRSFVFLLPSVVTLMALCVGSTSMRYAISGDFVCATGLIVVAAVMDALDGRIARFFNVSSEFGAQLDSLVDIVNFGVAPSVLIYLWNDMYNGGVRQVDWLIILFYMVCSVLRLARFNVESVGGKVDKFFTGLPITGGAMLILLPVMFNFKILNYIPSLNFLSFYTCLVSLLMVSRVPIFSAKKINKTLLPFVFVLFLVASLCAVVEPWLVLPWCGVLYWCLMPFGFIFRDR